MILHTIVPMEVIFENMQKSIATGQSVVLYDNDILIGGGIIDAVEEDEVLN